MIVVDSNLLGYLYLTSDQSLLAERALIKDPLWSAPLLWRSELRNVLAFYKRKQILSLVARSTCSAYDCEFVALANDLDIPLVATDKQILQQFPDIATSLEKFVFG